METVEFDVKSFVLTIVVFVLIGAAIAYASLQYFYRIQTVGTVKTIGVQIKDEYGNLITSIDWGTLTPNSSKDFHVYAVNNGTIPITLALTTENWNPPNAKNHISLTWNYLGNKINPGESHPIIFTLTVYANITGISDFSFDMVITAQEGG